MRGINAAPSLFADVSVFDFDVTGATTLNLQGGEIAYSRAVTAARAAGLTTFGTLVDHMGKGGMASVLADPAARAAHVQAIVDLAVARNLDGIDIDYENFAFTDGTSTWPTTRPLWVAFVTELGAAMHARGKLLAVSVPAIWDGGRRGYTVYDWAGIIDSVDRMRVMTYDWSSSQAGPNSPMTWVNSVIAYAQATIPGGTAQGAARRPHLRVQLRQGGERHVPLRHADVAARRADAERRGARRVEGRDAGARPRLRRDDLQLRHFVPGSAEHPADPSAVHRPSGGLADRRRGGRDRPEAGGPRDRPGQIVSCVVRRTVYYPDAQAVVDRANAALAGGLSGIAVWALGYESPDVWAALATVQAPSPATFLGTGTVGALEAATLTAGGVEVHGWAFDPEVGLPIDVQVSVAGGPWSDAVLARERRDDVAETFDGVGVDHGFRVVVPAAGSAGDTVCVRAGGWGDQIEPTEIGCLAGDCVEWTIDGRDRADRAHPDRAHPDRAHPDRARSDRTGADRAHPDRARSDRTGADRAHPDRAGGGAIGTRPTLTLVGTDPYRVAARRFRGHRGAP